MNKDKEKEKTNNINSDYDKIEKNISKIVEDHQLAYFLDQLKKYSGKFIAGENITELTDDDYVSMENEKESYRRQEKREWLRDLLKTILRHSGSYVELREKSIEGLELLDRIESGESRLWRQLDTVVFIVIEICRAEDEKQREFSKMQAELESQQREFGFHPKRLRE